MKCSTKMIENVMIIEIEGDIMGGSDSENFKNIIYKAIEKDTINIVADLTKATWINSSGLGLLITGLTSLRSSEGDLKLASIPERVKRPLEITKLDSVFLIYNSVDEAVASF